VSRTNAKHPDVDQATLVAFWRCRLPQLESGFTSRAVSAWSTYCSAL